MRYDGKVTIVTGGSKGIGEGCVRVFAEAGSKVVFCARNEAEGNKLAAEITKKGPGEAFFVKADMCKTADIQNLIDVTVKKYGRLDCLINNAGWHPAPSPIDNFSVEDFNYLLNFNLVSIFTACKFALPHLRKTKGNIINMSSLVGVFGQQWGCTYVATKGAITAFSKALAIDEAEHDVRVNSVSPGNIWTPLWKEFADGTTDPAAMKKGGDDAQPLGRMGTIEESGKLCLFIAAEATFTTGVDHIISGGAELGYGKKTRKS